jgi:hypothetical protein
LSFLIIIGSNAVVVVVDVVVVVEWEESGKREKEMNAREK